MVLKRHERMPQALGQVDGAPVDGIQQHGLPLPERRGADADVDDDVEQRSGDRGDLLRLRRRHVGEVDAAHGPSRGHRDVGLHDLRTVAEALGQQVTPKGLEETPRSSGNCRGVIS